MDERADDRGRGAGAEAVAHADLVVMFARLEARLETLIAARLEALIEERFPPAVDPVTDAALLAMLANVTNGGTFTCTQIFRYGALDAAVMVLLKGAGVGDKRRLGKRLSQLVDRPQGGLAVRRRDDVPACNEGTTWQVVAAL